MPKFSEWFGMDEVIKIIAQKCKSLGMTGETGWKIKELHDFELSNRGDTVSIYMGRKNFWNLLKDQNKRCLVFSGKEGSRFKGLYETVLVGFLYPRPEFYPNESFEKWEIEEEKQKVAAMGKDIEAALGKIKGYGKSLI